jgi:FkbM family methyltransferase
MIPYWVRIKNWLTSWRAVGKPHLLGCPFWPKRLTAWPVSNRAFVNLVLGWLRDFARAAVLLPGGPSAQVLLVEVLPDLVKELRARTAHLPNWQIAAVAAGAEPGTSEVHIDPRNDTIGSLKGFGEEFLVATVAGRGQFTKLVCEVKPLDAIVAEAGITSIDVLKIDVEGFEFEVLKGADQALRSSDVVIIEVSLVRSDMDGATALVRLMSIMQEKGFALVRAHPSIFDQRYPWLPAEYNVIFRRRPAA